MGEPTLCGTAVRGEGRMAGPFRRILGLGYYDGPTSGVIECAACCQEYRFELLDADWESWSSVPRIFSLSPLPPGSLDRIAAVCPQQDWPPDWSTRPCWVPRWQFPSVAQEEAAERQVRESLEQAAEPEWAVAWFADREERGIVAARHLEPADSRHIRELLSLCPDDFPPFLLDPLERRDWFAFLGLERRGQEDEPA